MEAEAYLNRLPMWANKKNSLKDIRIFLDQMGGPDRKIPAIHVAGTNGKGSVCAFMTSVLKKAGLRTGTFISPHLVEIRERFLINGEPAEKNAFEEAFETVKKQAEHMVEEGFCHPTFFDISDKIRKAIQYSPAKSGICVVYSRHTTCSIMIQELSHDKNYYGLEYLQQDICNVMVKLIPTCRS